MRRLMTFVCGMLFVLALEYGCRKWQEHKILDGSQPQGWQIWVAEGQILYDGQYTMRWWPSEDVIHLDRGNVADFDKWLKSSGKRLK